MQRIPLRVDSDRALFESCGEEILVYHLEDDSAHCLSSEAVAIWKLCDGASSEKQIAEQCGLTAHAVSEVVDRLTALGLVECDTSSDAPNPSRLLVRRNAIQFAAAAAATGGLIFSVKAPTAQAATSCPGGQLGGNGALCTRSACCAPGLKCCLLGIFSICVGETVVCKAL